MTPPATLGRRLRLCREAAGLTQVELAQRAGLDPQTISRYETDVMEPTVTNLERIGKVLNKPPGQMRELNYPYSLDVKTQSLFSRIKRKHGFTRMRLQRSTSMKDYSVTLLLDRDDGMGVNGSGFGETTNEAVQRALLCAESEIEAGRVFPRRRASKN